MGNRALRGCRHVLAHPARHHRDLRQASRRVRLAWSGRLSPVWPHVGAHGGVSIHRRPDRAVVGDRRTQVRSGLRGDHQWVPQRGQPRNPPSGVLADIGTVFARRRAVWRRDLPRRRHGQTRTMTEVTASIPALPRSSRPAQRRTNTATQWLAPVGLIVLSLIPVLAGALRLTELMSGPQITANNARFVASPIPVTVHIVSVTLYSLLGALQFVPSLRRGRPNWHRIAGRVLVPAGVLVALSGLWMNFFYDRPAGDGESLVVVRLIVGSAMLTSIVLAVVAIRRRDFT